MEPCLSKLKSYLIDHPIDLGEDVDSPCLDALWWLYAEYHPMMNETIKTHYLNIRNLVETLPLVDSEQMMDLLSQLGLEHERIAFFVGFRLGAQLMLEISGGTLSRINFCRISHAADPAFLLWRQL